METNQNNLKDQELWRIAKKRAGFKWSLVSYCVVNALLVLIWLMDDKSYFWPMWCMFGWGIGILFQYINAYHRTGVFSVDKEYEKLKNQ